MEVADPGYLEEMVENTADPQQYAYEYEEDLGEQYPPFPSMLSSKAGLPLCLLSYCLRDVQREGGGSDTLYMHVWDGSLERIGVMEVQCARRL